MNVANRSAPSATDFFDWVAGLPEGQRYELVCGEPVAMAPERARHSLVELDCAVTSRQALRDVGSGCTVFGDGMSVIVSEDTVYEPDVVVQCEGSIDYESAIVTRPVVLVEVLSPSTRGVDTGRKPVGYFQLPSVSHYLVVDPESRVMTHHFHSGDGIGTAILREGRSRLEPSGVDIEVADVFGSLP